MNWAEVFTILAVMTPFCLWLRSEGNADRREIMNMISKTQEKKEL